MRALLLGPLALDRCARCGGLWLDEGELEGLLEHLHLVDAAGRDAHWRPVGRRTSRLPRRGTGDH